MNTWINAILFELTWLSAVAGAGRGWWWAGPCAVSLFALWQLRPSRASYGDVPLIVLALLIGFAGETLLIRSGLLHYSAAKPYMGIAPIWILALWANLALTLNHSMAFLKSRPWLSALIGGLGAPLSYWGAGHGWGALTLARPELVTLLVLGAGWAVALPILTQTARMMLDAHNAHAVSVPPGDR